jgi:Ca2+-binding EF-hand superfamily protein
MADISLEQKRVIFEMFDEDKNGTVSMKELQSAFNKLFGVTIKEEDFNEILKEFDGNSDNGLDFDEFCKMGDNIDDFMKKHVE